MRPSALYKSFSSSSSSSTSCSVLCNSHLCDSFQLKIPGICIRELVHESQYLGLILVLVLDEVSKGIYTVQKIERHRP